MKFLADMGISGKTVEFLKNLGYDALHLHDQGLDRIEDSDILKKAENEERVLLTHDLDFGELIAASGGKLPSIVIFRLRNMKPEMVNKHLYQIITKHEKYLENGVVISIKEGQIRVRHLPVV